MMNWDAGRFWLDLIAMAVAGGAATYTWITNHDRATATEVRSLDIRLTRIEERVNSAPGHDDLGRIYERVNNLGEGLEGLRGELKGIAHQLGMLVQHMLNGGGK